MSYLSSWLVAPFDFALDWLLLPFYFLSSIL